MEPDNGCPCGLPCVAFQRLMHHYMAESRRDMPRFVRDVYGSSTPVAPTKAPPLVRAASIAGYNARELQALAGTACFLMLSVLPEQVVARRRLVGVGVTRTMRALQILTGAGGVAVPDERSVRLMGEVDDAGPAPERAAAVLGYAPLARPGEGAWFLHTDLAGLRQGSTPQRWAIITSLASGAVRILQRTPDATDIARVTVVFDTTMSSVSGPLDQNALRFLLRWSRSEQRRVSAAPTSKSRHVAFYLGIARRTGLWVASRAGHWNLAREPDGGLGLLGDDAVVVVVRHWDGPGTMIGRGGRGSAISCLALHNPATAHRVALAGGGGIRLAECLGRRTDWDRLYRDLHAPRPTMTMTTG